MKKKGVVISLIVVIALLMTLIIVSMFSKDSKSDDKKNDNKTENEVIEKNEETEMLKYLYLDDNKYILFSQDTNGGVVISSSVDSNTAKINTENYTTMKAIGSKVDGNNVTIGILMSDVNENTKAYIINIDKKSLNKEITSNSSVALNNISNSILPVNFDKDINFIGIYKKDKKENIMLVSDSEFYLVNNKGETSLLDLGESEK